MMESVLVGVVEDETRKAPHFLVPMGFGGG